MKYKIGWKGFTLVELLVVFSILGVMFTVVLAYYFDLKKDQQVRSGANEILVLIADLRQRALTGDVSGGGTEKPCGFGIHFSDGGPNLDSFDLFFNHLGGGGSCDTRKTGSSHTIPFAQSSVIGMEQAVYNGGVPIGDIFFNVPFARMYYDATPIDPAGAGTTFTAKIVVSHPSGGSEYTVCITRSAQVSVKKGTSC